MNFTRVTMNVTAASLALLVTTPVWAQRDFSPMEGSYETERLDSATSVPRGCGISGPGVDVQIRVVDAETLAFETFIAGTCMGGFTELCSMKGRVGNCAGLERDVPIIIPALGVDAVLSITSFSAADEPDMFWSSATQFIRTQDVTLDCAGTGCDFVGSFVAGGVTFPCSAVNSVTRVRHMGDFECPAP